MPTARPVYGERAVGMLRAGGSNQILYLGYLSTLMLQIDFVVDAGGSFFFVVADEDERLVGTLTEGLDDVFHQAAVHVVKSVERFVENQQFGVFYEGTCQEHQSLLAARHLEE